MLVTNETFFIHGIIFTARKRSLGQGNIFRSMCQEFYPRGGAWSEGVCSGGLPALGGCLVETPPMATAAGGDSY